MLCGGNAGGIGGHSLYLIRPGTGRLPPPAVARFHYALSGDIWRMFVPPIAPTEVLDPIPGEKFSHASIQGLMPTLAKDVLFGNKYKKTHPAAIPWVPSRLRRCGRREWATL